MGKYKRPCELRTKVIRINLDDYRLLDEICRIRHITMAEALSLVLKEIKLPRHLFVKPSSAMSVKLVPSVSVRPRVVINQNGGIR